MKPSAILKNSLMNNQNFRTVTTSRQTIKQKTSNRNNFSDHNHIFFKFQNNEAPNTNNQNQSQSQNQNVPQQVLSLNSLTISHEPHKMVATVIHFSKKIKI